jgi:quercetin 2,3-dioxygenase
MKTAVIDVRRAAERFHTEAGWLDSWHSFSFAEHHDPGNTGHGLLIVNNDDVIAPGAGFGMHPHRDMEIVTWVLEGALRHADSKGNKGVITPGLAQRMSAGSGIFHSEENDSDEKPARLVQMWVLPDVKGVAPSYEQKDMSAALARGGLVAVASGADDGAALRIHQKGAKLWVGRLKGGEKAQVPAAPHAHVFVAEGGAALEKAGALTRGDAVRLTGAGTLALTAGSGGAEILIWETT